MNLRVLGCHGGTSRDHRSVSFLVEGHLALDAGSLALSLSLSEQAQVDTVLVTHPHIDHIGDLGTLCDSRTHLELSSLVVAGTADTLAALRDHFFNGVLWPDFTRIRGGRERVARLEEIRLETARVFGGLTVTAIRVDHSIPSCGFVVTDGSATLAYSGDTGPTERFWQALNALPRLDALITEISFPDRMEELARRSGHLTPTSMRAELDKLEHRDTPVYVYGFKPAFVEEIQIELEQHEDDDRERISVLEPGQELRL